MTLALKINVSISILKSRVSISILKSRVITSYGNHTEESKTFVEENKAHH